MSSLALKYNFNSQFLRTSNWAGLELAANISNNDNFAFLDAELYQSSDIAMYLLNLSTVIRTNFLHPSPPMLDPVITTHENVVRFEGFSSCCGVYARVDIDSEVFKKADVSRGTTNVDFNDRMRTTLVQLKNNNKGSMRIANDSIKISTDNVKTTEKKVNLPSRWIKGFSEVQVYLPKLKREIELSPRSINAFIKRLPIKDYNNQYLVPQGKSLRLSRKKSKGAAPVSGLHRLKIIEQLLPVAKKIYIWSDQETECTAWEIQTENIRSTLCFSPEISRGFSGEGQLLNTLIKENNEYNLDAIEAYLNWNSNLNLESLAEQSGVEAAVAENSLKILGTRGLAGFDLNQGTFFHRRLPFHRNKAEQNQPRLRSAKKLVENNDVSLIDSEGDHYCFSVRGTDVVHTVNITPNKSDCTCQWYHKYHNLRGPCKHILAAKISLQNLKG